MPPKAILWTVKPEHILAAVEWSCKKLYHSIDRPGMNKRRLTERLDDKIMGDIATVAVVEYLRYGLKIQAVAYDQIRQNQFKLPDPGWDVAFGENTYQWAQTTGDPRVPVGLTTASIRSSRLVKTDTINQAIANRDFKIFAPQGVDIGACITADIEIQVYYDYQKSLLAERKIDDVHVRQCIQDRARCEEIVNLLDIESRYGKCYLTAWNDKASIVQYSNTLEVAYWSSYGKRMWFAPLRFGKDMQDIASFVKSEGI